MSAPAWAPARLAELLLDPRVAFQGGEGRLRVIADPGVLSDADRQLLREHRDRLIEVLTATSGGAEPSAQHGGLLDPGPSPRPGGTARVTGDEAKENLPDFDAGVTRVELERSIRGVDQPPPRPAGDPVYGYTTRMHVVELARRTLTQEQDDPVRLVTAPGWSAWYPRQESDAVTGNEEQPGRCEPRRVGRRRREWPRG